MVVLPWCRFLAHDFWFKGLPEQNAETLVWLMPSTVPIYFGVAEPRTGLPIRSQLTFSLNTIQFKRR